MLLTVDDDPSVSRAVARDLRRRYGEDFRDRPGRVRAGRASTRLKEILRRGERVAAILADYRMPHMNGIDFLEQAMDLFPRARRALLTAYADTDAAIQAINLVDVDQYLLKPWEPPEEKLYPVVDELIATWEATGDAAVPETKVVGHHWSQPSYADPGLPGPQLGALPLVRRGRAGRAAPADGVRGDRGRRAGRHRAGRHRAACPDDPRSWPRRSG